MSVEDDGIGVLCGSFILLLLSAQDVYDVEIGGCRSNISYVDVSSLILTTFVCTSS